MSLARVVLRSKSTNIHHWLNILSCNDVANINISEQNLNKLASDSFHATHKHTDIFLQIILNLVNLLTLALSSVDISKGSNTSKNSEILSNETQRNF